VKRRTWLLGATGAAGALLVGWGAMPARSRIGSSAFARTREGEIALNGWIKIAQDGSVVLAMPRSEMGQGVHTALPMLAAEELDVPLSAMRIEQAGFEAIYGNVANILSFLPFHPQEEEAVDGFARTKVKASRWVVGKVARELGINATGGSTSVSDAWDAVRQAAATARASLVGAASLQWRLPVEELVVKEGVISHPSGKMVTYAEMARFASATPPGTVRLKDRKDWKVIGRTAARLDVPAKVDGTAQFGLDVRLPGMKFAAVRLAPAIGGAPGAIDATAALRMPGVERIVMLPPYAGSSAGFAIVAKTYWHAQRAAQAVDVRWEPRPAGNLDSRQVANDLERAVKESSGFTFFSVGDVQAAESKAQKVVEAWYSAPYLAHATMEPMNCTARVAGGKVEIWVPTQVPGLCREAAARVAGMRNEDVTVHLTLLGGGFGRRLEVDYAACAVRVAMDCGGAPVQLVWSREEDMTHDFYRPMQVARLRGVLDARGRPESLSVKSAGDAISPRWIERALPALAGPIDVPDKTASEGLFDQPYAFGNQAMEHVATRSGVPVGFWRSVGHSHNAFMLESFIDELASAAGQDPLRFRQQLLGHAPRHLAVLNLAAEKSGWGSALPVSRARGLAVHESFGTVVAQVAEVSVDAGELRVHRVVCAVDCGTVVNPGIVAQQMESSVVFALGAALRGRIDIHDGVVQQRNFPDYQLVRLARAPKVETFLIPSERVPSGAGEPGVAPLAPAVANALFALTGKRLRSLPLAG
jgi:isoquinoline 1-oxidoreductase beta subunit